MSSSPGTRWLRGRGWSLSVGKVSGVLNEPKYFDFRDVRSHALPEPRRLLEEGGPEERAWGGMGAGATARRGANPELA